VSESTIGILIIAFFASLAPTITAFAALTVSRHTDRKADDIIQKTVEIHTLTNSNLAKVQSDLQTALARIDEMKIQIEQMRTPISVSPSILPP